MEQEPPLIDRARLRAFLEQKPALPMKAAPDGRFIIRVPDFGDGKGPLLMPNIKELDARLRGSEGEVTSIELEAGPQKVPADGTNVIVINRVDQFAAMALSAKLDYLIDSADGELTRGVLQEFMGYARGYTYNPDTQKITFARNAGFRNDVYNMPIAELKKRYIRYSRQDLSLDNVKEGNIRPGYYLKRPLESRGVWLDGAFRVQLPKEAGGAIQEFQKGALVNLPDDPTLPISFVHLTDISTSYTLRNGAQIVDADGAHNLPSYKVEDTQRAPSAQTQARKQFPKR